jgi:Predicted transcriptional regulators
VTVAVALVLRVFLEDVTESRYGYDLMRRTGFASGKLYPILARLQRAGWLVREHEDVDPAVVGRPARALYRLSPDGVRIARYELAALAERLRPPTRATRRLRPEGGRA